MRYSRVVQKPGLCAPSCIEMLLKARALAAPDQEAIAFELQAKVEAKNKHLYTRGLPLTQDPGNVGLVLADFNKGIAKRFFGRFGLKVRPLLAHELPRDFKAFIKENLEQGNDILVNPWMRPFFGQEDFGHFVLVERLEGNEAVLADPYPENPATWKADLEKLKQSMFPQSDDPKNRERGLVIIS